MWRERARDSAYASNIPLIRGIAICGYLPGGSAYNAWTAANWARFGRRRKLPIFVATEASNRDGKTDAFTALRGLYDLGVPKGVYTVLDLETIQAPGYVSNYFAVMQWAGYKVLVYGSASTVFGNPRCNGYWVADYAGTGPFMFNRKGVRMTQYANPANDSGGEWDSSTVAPYMYAFGTWWR